MINNSPSNLKKFAIGAISLAMVVTLSSCSKGKKNAADPSASASISASASASASASVAPSKKPIKKPVITNTPKPKYKPIVPVKPLAKKPYLVTVAPTPEVKLTKDQLAFQTALKKALSLDKKGWNDKHLAQPLEYKITFDALADYAKTVLCAYMQTGIDDFTMGQYLDGEVSYLQDVKDGVIKATSSAFKCKPL